MMELRGQTALVTGASSGLGEAFARELAKAGAHLILAARSREKLEKLAEEIRRESGVTVHVFLSDLAWPEASQNLFDALKREKLQVDYLINNAGFGYCGAFEENLTEKYREMIQVNVSALTELTRIFLPGMLERKSGGIMNVASTAGFQPLPGVSVYAATKAYVLHFTEALWAECRGRGVRIFCLCPGNTRTQFHETAGFNPKRVFFQADAESVVRFALRTFLYTDKPYAVYGFRNKILSMGYRFGPRSLVARIAQIFFG